jgi:hypothetical protein
MIGLPITQARRRRPGKPIDVGDLVRRQSYAPPIRVASTPCAEYSTYELLPTPMFNARRVANSNPFRDVVDQLLGIREQVLELTHKDPARTEIAVQPQSGVGG